jgi:Cu/Ag efflux pump CusA
MIRSVVAWSLRYRLLMLGIGAAIVLFGATQLPNMPVASVPEFTPTYVEVQTEALGLSADEVEQLITVPLEADLLQGVAFLDEIHSQSVAGLSSVVMIFEPGTDVFRARQVVSERLTQAHALPHVSKPPTMIQPLSSTNRLLMVSLSSKDVSMIDMSVQAQWTIRPRLMSVPGVANVAIWGMRDRQLQVLVDPARLARQGVTLQQVIETTGNSLWVSPLTFLDASTPGTGGFIDTPNQRLGVHHVFPVRTPEDLASIVIPPDDTGGRVVTLGDVATVIQDHQPLIGDAVVADGSGLMLVVEKFPDADTTDVTHGVEKALAALAPGLTGITVDTHVFRPATFIEEAFSNLAMALLAALLLAALALVVFLRGWRPALIALVSVLLSMVAAIVVLYVMGATVNAVALAGLMIAALVVIDDAIVGVEAVSRRLRQPREADAGRSARSIVIDSVTGSRGPAFTTWLIVGLAIVPLFLLSGVAGSFLPPMLLTYLAASLVGMLVALTVTPALASLLLSETQRPQRAIAASRRLTGSYRSALTTVLGRSRAIYGAAAVMTVVVIGLAGLTIAAQADRAFMPQFKERDLLVAVNAAPGTSAGELQRIAARAAAELRTVPGVKGVGGHVGRAIASDQVVGTDSGAIWVSIDRSADYDATRAAIEGVIGGYPGLALRLGTYTNDRIERVLGAPQRDVVVRVYGQDQAVIRQKAEEVQAALGRVDGLSDVAMSAQTEEPTLQLEVDLAAAERLGLKPGDVRRATTTLLSGLEVGLIFEEQKVFQVIVWGDPSLRDSLETIRALPIQAANGAYVPLSQVASVTIAPAPSVIQREGVFRYVDVGASVSGRDLGGVLADVDDAVAGIDFPFEYRAEVLGSALQRQDLLIRLAAVMVGVLIGVLLLLQAAFGSWRRAAALLVTLPAALLGVMAGVWLLGGALSIGVIAGLLVVLTFAVRHGILMVDHYQALEREPGAAFDPDLIVDGAQSRLTPVLTAAAVIALTVLPLIVLGGVAGLEILRPMAVVVFGGIVTSTIFALFVVPVVIFGTGPSPEPEPESQPQVEQPSLSPA